MLDAGSDIGVPMQARNRGEQQLEDRTHVCTIDPFDAREKIKPPRKLLLVIEL